MHMPIQPYPKITLAAARVNAGLNQQDAAKALGISVAPCKTTSQERLYHNGVPSVKLRKCTDSRRTLFFYPSVRFKRIFSANT